MALSAVSLNTTPSKTIDLTRHSLMHVSSDKTLSANDVLTNNFHPVPPPPFKLPPAEKVLWFQFTVNNLNSQELSVILSTAAIFNRELSLYRLEKAGPVKVGIPLKLFAPNLRFTLKPGMYTYLLKLRNDNNSFQFQIRSIESELRLLTLNSLSMGISIIFVFIALYLSLGNGAKSTRKAAWYYLAFTSCLLLSLTSMTGTFRILYQGRNLEWLTYNLSIASLGLCIFMAIKVHIHIMNYPEQAPSLKFTLDLFTYPALIFSAISLFKSPPILTNIFQGYIVLIIALAVFISFHPVNKLSYGYKLIGAGWIALALGGGLVILSVQAIITRYWFSPYYLFLGGACQAIAFSSCLVIIDRKHNIEQQEAMNKLERKAMEDDKQQSIVRIERERNDALSSLIHVFSHDLRNPLSSILGYSEILQDQLANHPSHPIISRIHRSAKTMEEIIYMVNEQEAIRLNKKKLKLRDTNLLSCIEDTIQLFDTRLLTKGISTHIECNLDHEVLAYCEPTALTYCVFANLVSNAIKFSPPKSGVIQWNLKEENGYPVVEILDFGEGMSQEQMTLINEGSLSSHTSTEGTGGESGTGFGIQQVQRFLLLMGGKLTVNHNPLSQNQESPGTCFAIQLQKPQNQINTPLDQEEQTA